MEALVILAATESGAENGGLLAALGVDVKLLVVQAIAFLILLWVLSKYVYPVISGMLEKREAAIREGMEMAHKSEENAQKANEKAEKLLSDARKQAGEVIASAKDEAAAIVAAANENAVVQTESMIERANADIEKQVESAKNSLREETIGLVALATEKVLGGVVTDAVDRKLISAAVKDAEKV